MEKDLNKEYAEFVGGLLTIKVHFDEPGIMHSIMGISTEAGELMDQLKRAMFYGTEFDIVNIREEVGDLLYYTMALLNETGLSIEECMKVNIEKLKKRYPEGFSTDKAINRDLEGEREILESEK